MQSIFRDIALPFNHIFDQIIVFMFGLSDKKNIFIGFGVLGKSGDQSCFIGVADIVLTPIGDISTFGKGCQLHFRGVKIRAMLFF